MVKSNFGKPKIRSECRWKLGVPKSHKFSGLGFANVGLMSKWCLQLKLLKRTVPK